MNLLKKNEKFVDEAQDEVFTELQDFLCSELLLQYLDFNKSFVVTMNASGYADPYIESRNDRKRFIHCIYFPVN